MRRLVTTLISSAFALPLVIAACSTSGEQAFATLQACYDDHVSGVEHLSPAESIVVCCIEHPIAGHTVVCKDTVGDCIVFVDAELGAGTTAAEIQAGCSDYVRQKGV